MSVGFLGAMQGLGEGLSDYGETRTKAALEKAREERLEKAKIRLEERKEEIRRTGAMWDQGQRYGDRASDVSEMGTAALDADISREAAVNQARDMTPIEVDRTRQNTEAKEDILQPGRLELIDRRAERQQENNAAKAALEAKEEREAWLDPKRSDIRAEYAQAIGTSQAELEAAIMSGNYEQFLQQRAERVREVGTLDEWAMRERGVDLRTGRILPRHERSGIDMRPPPRDNRGLLGMGPGRENLAPQVRNAIGGGQPARASSASGTEGNPVVLYHESETERLPKNTVFILNGVVGVKE